MVRVSVLDLYKVTILCLVIGFLFYFILIDTFPHSLNRYALVFHKLFHIAGLELDLFHRFRFVKQIQSLYL